MVQKRRNHSPQLKFRIALEASKERKTMNEIAGENSLHPNQISQWKKKLAKDGPIIFSNNSSIKQRKQETIEAELYEQIGRLKMELEWLKKKASEFN